MTEKGPSLSDVFVYDISAVHGYHGFKLYFPIPDEVDIEETLEKVRIFENYLIANADTFPLLDVEKDNIFMVDYKQLIDDNDISLNWSNFKEDMLLNAEHYLHCLSLAMHQLLMLEFKKKFQESTQIDGYCFFIRNIRARLYNHYPVLQLKELKTNVHGKLVTIRGTVMKIGNTILQCTYMTFQCSTCSGTQLTKQQDGNYVLPTKCLTKGCRAQSSFIPLVRSQYTKMLGTQLLRIQELIEDTQGEKGRTPRTYECELTEDLLDCCNPGDDVTVTGVIKSRNIMETSSRHKQASIFNFHLAAVSVVNNKNQSQSGQITFTTEDYYAIRKIHDEPLLFRFLVHSLCPTIYGNEIIKAGLLLALFSGDSSSASMDTRSQSHVLMVGDPGLGKSQMLQACTSVAPRGVYVCGKATTTSGLTVTVKKDSGGQYALEAGALVLADQGSCCIDEFDKMSAQHKCLLEAMEQQNVSIAKAGITCNLPTRTTILAAANPTEGHYNKQKSVVDNLKIQSAMLSRFDLIFILLDKPDVEFDTRMPQHVLNLHLGSKYKKRTIKAQRSLSSTMDYQNFREYLKLQPNESIEHLPHALFRKYIAYAQKYVKPELSNKAKDVLRDFYLKLREKAQNRDTTPVIVRQLYSLIRLTKTRAKAELREEATESDAKDVVEVMRYCLRDIQDTENTDPDEPVIPKARANLKSTSKNQFNALLKYLQKLAKDQGSRIFTTKQLRECCEHINIDNEKIGNTLDVLNQQNFILSKGGGNFQLQL